MRQEEGGQLEGLWGVGGGGDKGIRVSQEMCAEEDLRDYR